MDLPNHQSERLAAWLGERLDVEPPAKLRGRLLRRYRFRRSLAPTSAAAAAVVLVFVSFWFGTSVPTIEDDELARWQARSMRLEADWRQTGDRLWLTQDARAQTLLARLQLLDRDLARLHALGTADRDTLSQLWRTRSDILAALVDSSRQGGTAMRI